jgi:hypothetical protein
MTNDECGSKLKVAQDSVLLYRRFLTCRAVGWPWASRKTSPSAVDEANGRAGMGSESQQIWKSAIQQTKSLRYDLRTASPPTDLQSFSTGRTSQ